jgi:potassium-dependent mechanosensitive channel
MRVSLLFLIALCIGPFSLAQSSNPLGTLLGKKSQAAASPTTPAPVATPPAEAQTPTAIPLPDVAVRAEELKRMLRDLSSQLPDPEQLNAVKAALDEREEPLQAKQKEVQALFAGSPSPLEIREQETYWQSIASEGAAARRQLHAWANAAQSAIQQLRAQEPQWTATLEENESTTGPGPALDVIHDAVKDIQATRQKAQEQLRLIVNLQVQAADQDERTQEILDVVARARTEMQGHILKRDSLPLWKINERRQQGESPNVMSGTIARVIGIKTFVAENAGVLMALAVFLFLSLLAAYRLHVMTRGLEPADECAAQAAEILQHWFALGLLLPLMLAYFLAPSAPLSLLGVSIVISFIPILTLLPPLVDPRYRALLRWLPALYVVSAFLNWAALSPAVKREVAFFTALAAVVVFGILLRPGRIDQPEGANWRCRLMLLAMRLGVAMIAAAMVANLFGYFKLSQFLGVFCLYSTFVAVAILTVVRVYTLLLVAGLNSPVAERLAAVRLYRGQLLRWTPRVLRWVGFFLWLGAALGLAGIREWTNQALGRVVAFNLVGGSANITLGGVLGFFLILLGGYAVSSAIRFLLREELLNRFHLTRGVPELITTTLHYLLLLLVFLFAVNAGGVELNRFTVLTGALGVGVGFGLQNVINNFVSGLILQFERPIRVGDVIDTGGNVTGTVTRIGIRSSTVQTFQGAEIIIPNATFISGNVTNWTLSESKRRVELPVGVAYGTDAKVVKELLERPAMQHPDVLTSPPPEAFFMGFGDSALNFELRFWVMQDSNTVKMKSEVALEVMRLLEEAGIEIPFPQRDLRLRSVDAQAAAALSGDGLERQDLHARISSPE